MKTKKEETSHTYKPDLTQFSIEQERKRPAKQERAMRHAILFTEQSLTRQADKDDCDVNQILEKYKLTGTLSHVSNKPMSYLDLASVPDYQAGLNMIVEAQAAFDQLPANLRERFSNDPKYFLEFVSKPENIKEMVSLGIATEKELETITHNENEKQSKRESKTAPKGESKPKESSDDSQS